VYHERYALRFSATVERTQQQPPHGRQGHVQRVQGGTPPCIATKDSSHRYPTLREYPRVPSYGLFTHLREKPNSQKSISKILHTTGPNVPEIRHNPGPTA
jgi:hypothetical protein